MIEELKKLGLTEYEAKVYSVLLKLKTATGGQIAEESKVPHGKTYESLRSLSEKGLITTLPVEPKMFKLVDPSTGIKNLIERRETALEETGKSFLDSIKKVEIPSKKAIEKLEVASGVEKQYETARNMMDTAKKQLLIISRGEKVPFYILKKGKEITRKGVDYRLIVYDLSNTEWLRKFKDAGVNLRHFKTGEFTLAVKDQEEVMLVVRNPKLHEDRVLLFFRDIAIAKAMAVYFETIWKQAKEVKV